jgi:alpha-galactosidase
VEELEVDLRFEKTLDREAALSNADFVINTAQVGGHPKEEAERRSMEEHGYYRGVRPLLMQSQLSMMLSVARDVERICPAAWLILSANPVFEGCTLIARETGVNVVGLCHGFRDLEKICHVLGIDPSEVNWQALGFNHVIYLTHFRCRGRDAYPLLDDWIENEAEHYWDTHRPKFSDVAMSKSAIDHYRRVGFMPLGDTARANAGYVTWWYHTDLETKKYWFGPLGGFDSEIGWQQYLQSLRRRLDDIACAVQNERTPVSEALPLEHSGEIQVSLIDSLANDVERKIQVNVPNNGAIQGIPDNVVVEVPAIVSGNGIQPLQIGQLPETLMMQVMLPRWLLMERTLSAYLRRDYSLLRDIVLEDHRTQSLEQADAMMEAWLSMPENKDAARWYGRRQTQVVRGAQ